MAKLSVLGAQRVKALAEILNEKLKEEIANLNIPSFETIEKMVDEEFGVTKVRLDLELALEQARALAKTLNKETGSNISISEHGYSGSSSDYKTRKNKLVYELRDKPIQELRSEYKRKEQMLWLCETLEEAKELVGLGGGK